MAFRGTLSSKTLTKRQLIQYLAAPLARPRGWESLSLTVAAAKIFFFLAFRELFFILFRFFEVL